MSNADTNIARRLRNEAFSLSSKAALGFCALILVFLLGSIIYQGGRAVSFEFWLSPAQDFGKSGGILYQILGSLFIVVTAAALVLPIALGASVYRLSYMKSPKMQAMLDLTLYALNAIPSITYGIFGLIFFVNILGTGLSWFVGSIILAIMMLPTVTLASYQTMASLPQSYSENALALGLSRAQLIRRVIIPQSAHGVVTGLLLALARAIGETAPIMFIATAFSGVTVPRSLLEPVATLPTHILALAQQSTDPAALQNAWGASLTLIMFVAALSGLAYYARHKLSRLSQR